MDVFYVFKSEVDDELVKNVVKLNKELLKAPFDKELLEKYRQDFSRLEFFLRYDLHNENYKNAHIEIKINGETKIVGWR